MPFVQRIVTPKYLSRTSLHNENGDCIVNDCELDAVANNTLSNALRQLASLVLIANDIFIELSAQLHDVAKRSNRLKTKLGEVENKVSNYDPKKVTVPESDISTFAALRAEDHYVANRCLTERLFESTARPHAVKQLYANAIDRELRKSTANAKSTPSISQSAVRELQCTPILGSRRKNVCENIDIETRMPAVVEELRRWTSGEALGDITVAPSCASRINTTLNTWTQDSDTTNDGIDHKLPSPEEQVQAIAMKFPAEVVVVDVSGKRFDRMSAQRRSLLHVDLTVRTEQDVLGSSTRDSIKRSRTRKLRTKRRNTIAGTDQKEIREVLSTGEQPSTSSKPDSIENVSVFRSKSSDLLRVKKESPSESKKSHFNTLKQWGMNRLKFINKSFESKSNDIISDTENMNVYETVTVRRRKSANATALTFPNVAVKLRERKQRSCKDEPHSSSGNWSASSESGRTSSVGSEVTGSTAQPRSTSSASTAPGSVLGRRRICTAPGSVTSEGTLTPDITVEDDGDSSVYSCDTEGYYTSFHVDSGLKTLKEEESAPVPSTPLHSTTALSNVSALSAENEYELFGKGSTSTTTSSAGTVCTTLVASGSQRSLVIGPAVPERKSSLSRIDRSEIGFKKITNTVTAMIHEQNDGDVSPDSGHNTSSSPIESINSPIGQHSCSEFEFSESSDLEGIDRIERIRIKTIINSSRIPSMCVITPPHSDDESVKNCISSKSTDVTKNSNVEHSSHTGTSSDQISKNLPFKYLETDIDEELAHEQIGTKVVVAPINGTKKIQLIKVNPTSGYATVSTFDKQSPIKKQESKSSSENERDNTEKGPSKSPLVSKATLQPLNTMIGKLKSNFTNFTHRIDLLKTPPKETQNDEYDVTSADAKNNNDKVQAGYCSTDIIKRNLVNVLTGQQKTEYVSLNELPTRTDSDNRINADSLERRRRQGARVTLDSEGKVIYSSDSLKRKKGAHTTFEPGPYVKTDETASESPASVRRVIKTVRPVNRDNRPLSPRSSKIVIRANGKSSAPEVVHVQSPTIVAPSGRSTSPRPAPSRGAYVNVQDPQEAAADEESSFRINNPVTADVTDGNSPVHRRFDDNIRNSSLYKTLPIKKLPAPQDIIQRHYSPDLNRQQTTYNNRISHQNIESEYGNIDNKTRYLDSSAKTYSPIQKQNYFSSSTPTKLDASINNRGQLGFNNFFSPINYKQGGGLIMEKQGDKLEDSLKISPIDPRNISGSGTLTPTLDVQGSNAAVDLLQKLSPRKSTMSHEELYTVIHKRKKKFNIGNLVEKPSENETIEKSDRYVKPEQKHARNTRGGPQTSTLDFKRLLLQHKSNPISDRNCKISAVEQLKLSQLQKPKEGNSSVNILNLSSSPRNLNRKLTGPGSPRHDKQRVVSKLMSPRTNWKFTNPRTDILSSTIPEDCREDESPNGSSEKDKKPPHDMKHSSPIPNTYDRGYLQARRAEFFMLDNRESSPPKSTTVSSLETAL